MLQVIRMCLWPKVDEGNNTIQSLVSLGCTLGTNFTSGIIPISSTPIKNYTSLKIDHVCICLTIIFQVKKHDADMKLAQKIIRNIFTSRCILFQNLT